ncbi:MAG: alpha/beta fold hydrolase [Bacillota bacterium]
MESGPDLNLKKTKLRKYGTRPYNIVVVHGGPGAPGEMKPVAEELSQEEGVLEPFQSRHSITGQVQELKNIIREEAKVPVMLIGYSWGAWLSYIFTARNQEMVKKVILISSGPFQQKYVTQMNETRDKRMAEEDKKKIKKLEPLLMDPEYKEKDRDFSEFGKIMSKIDSYNPLPQKDIIIEFQPELFSDIMKEANQFRESEKLLRMRKNITCPVVAIHGDYDPHPYSGVKKPLSRVIKDFKFVLLNNCGHSPWKEKEARDKFYKIIKNEIDSV